MGGDDFQLLQVLAPLLDLLYAPSVAEASAVALFFSSPLHLLACPVLLGGQITHSHQWTALILTLDEPLTRAVRDLIIPHVSIRPSNCIH